MAIKTPDLANSGAPTQCIEQIEGITTDTGQWRCQGFTINQYIPSGHHTWPSRLFRP